MIQYWLNINIDANIIIDTNIVIYTDITAIEETSIQ